MDKGRVEGLGYVSYAVLSRYHVKSFQGLELVFWSDDGSKQGLLLNVEGFLWCRLKDIAGFRCICVCSVWLYIDVSDNDTPLNQNFHCGCA